MKKNYVIVTYEYDENEDMWFIYNSHIYTDNIKEWLPPFNSDILLLNVICVDDI